MPTVAIVQGVAIQFFFSDHPPPHFHARFAGHQALIALNSWDVLEGSLPAPKLRAVLNWARAHEEEAGGLLEEGSGPPTAGEDRMKLGNTIVAVEVPRFPLVRLTYADGYTASLDFSEKFAWGEATRPLSDPVLFATAHVGSGESSLEWIGPDGEEIDFCADALRFEAEALAARPAAE